MTTLPSPPVSGKSTSPLLGEIVTWDLASLEVPFEQIMAGLTAAGLPTDTAADLRAVTAFRRAVKDLRENRSIDRIKTEADKESPVVYFQFTRKELEAHRLEFAYETTVTLDTTTGDIDCPNDQIEEHARRMFAHCTTHRTTSDVTRLVQTMFQRHADLYPINPRKGVAYFVPECHRDFSARMETFLKTLGGRLLRFPVPKGTPEGNRSVKESVEAGLTALVSELDQTVDEWDRGTRTGTMDKAVKTWSQIKHKAEAYSEYLGDRQTALLHKLEETKARLAAKVDELTAAKNGGQRELFAAVPALATEEATR